MRDSVVQATTLFDLFSVMQRDFFVAAPCESMARRTTGGGRGVREGVWKKGTTGERGNEEEEEEKGVVVGDTVEESSLDERLDEPLEGTRLTLVAKGASGSASPWNPAPNAQLEQGGFDFTIRTPGTPPRWARYHAELEYAFAGFLDEYLRVPGGDGGGGGGVAGDECDSSGKFAVASIEQWERITHCVLAVFYSWVNFGPLTRGSAATGYAALFGMAAAAGLALQPCMPEGVQADWEAILSGAGGLSAFVGKMRPLFFVPFVPFVPPGTARTARTMGMFGAAEVSEVGDADGKEVEKEEEEVGAVMGAGRRGAGEQRDAAPVCPLPSSVRCIAWSDLHLLPDVRRTFPTLRDVIRILNVED